MINSASKQPKLRKVQALVMLWLSQGWNAHVRCGSAVEINGKRICNTSTLNALEKHGLVFKEPSGVWAATVEGNRLSPRHGEEVD